MPLPFVVCHGDRDVSRHATRIAAWIEAGRLAFEWSKQHPAALGRVRMSPYGIYVDWDSVPNRASA